MKPNQVAVKTAGKIMTWRILPQLIRDERNLRTLAREYLKMIDTHGDWHLRRGGKRAPAKVAKKKGRSG